MEKEIGSPGSGGGEVGVGSIVWVRRRNGSWWPGKILEPEELSVSHLMSPRSGTPVKLLGREDASVDWYNLEKSKRVKAFRCGEFNDCIERAESSQGMPIKKREKYARREDAILHALELEKQQLMKQEKLGTTSDLANSNSSGAVKKELATSSENDKGKLENSKSLNILDLSNKDEIDETSLHSDKAKEENQPCLEDNKSEVMPRMRGLQDFGPRTAPTKRKSLSSVVSNGSQTPTIDENSEAPLSGALNVRVATNLNGKISLDKRKRSHEELADKKSLVKRRDRRRPLVQVLLSSPNLEVSDPQPDSGTVCTSISGAEQLGAFCQGKRSKCVYFPTESGDSLDCKEDHPSQVEMSSSQFEDGTDRPHLGSFIEQNTFGFVEDFETESSETDSSEPDSDSSETEPDVHADMTLLSEPDPWAVERSEAIGGHGSMSSEEHEESAHSGDMPHFYPHDPVSANEAVSKWQLKGKRNVRCLPKRSADATDGKAFNGSIYGTYSGGKETSIRHRTFGQSLSFHRNGDFINGFDDAYLNEKDLGNHMVGLDNGEYSLASRSTSKRRRSHGMLHWEDLGWEDSINEYWGDRRNHFDPVHGLHPLGGWGRSTLVDVDLKVQASYQKEPVPIVSLMSKVNGQAIIGHPIQIEELEDSASDTLLSTNEDLGNKVISNDGNGALQPAWRTARRTAKFRVPRPHLSSALASDEVGEDLPLSDKARPPLKKLNAEGLGQKASLTKKNLPHIPRPPTDKKFPRKSPKKVSLSSNQKTRTLSSIAIEQNLSNPVMHDSINCQVDGLIKSESSGPTTVACIPVKLVFSRLLEKINRPPSKPVSNSEV